MVGGKRPVAKTPSNTAPGTRGVFRNQVGGVPHLPLPPDTAPGTLPYSLEFPPFPPLL